MQEWLSLFVLAIVQGIAEWVPISSSSQIAIVAHLLDYDLSVYTSIALHFGTLMAVCVYFGKDIIEIIRDILNGNWKTTNAKMGFALIIAAIPAGLAGYFLNDFIESVSGNFSFMVSGLFITSLILFIGNLAPKKKENLSYATAFIIGLAQIASLFRGISRSGSTIVSGLLLGLDEKTAVKFSFLLSIPIVFGANMIALGNTTLPPVLAFGSIVSFIIGISTIHFSFTYILNDRKNLKWFGLFVLIEALLVLVFLVL